MAHADKHQRAVSHDQKYPFTKARAVASELCRELLPFCDRIEIAGSIRREKTEVGDIEILYIPKFEDRPVDLLTTAPVSLVDEELCDLLATGKLQKRPSKIGVFTWGPENKLGLHTASGIPVDFFATTEKKWWNALVCRTGGKDNNLLITTTARRKGWTFEAYGDGFTKLDGSQHHVTTSERDVYDFLGLEYLEPWQRR